MRVSAALVIFALAPASAFAHPGHMVAGLVAHDHWVAGAAISAALAIGLWGALKGRGRPVAESADEPADDDSATQEG